MRGNTTPAGRSVFTQFRVFPIFTSVDITVYQYEKNVLYFFYNRVWVLSRVEGQMSECRGSDVEGRG